MLYRPYILSFICAVALGFPGSNMARADDNPWEQRFASRAVDPTENLDAVQRPAPVPHYPLERDAGKIYPVTFEEAERAIGRLLEEKGAGESIEATIIQRRVGNLLEHHAPVTVDIGDLFFHADSQKWEAVLYPSSQGRNLAPVSLEGRYREMVAVPVLRKRMRHGDIIDDGDITEIHIAANRLREDTVLDRDRLIGMSPKRGISEDRPVRESEIVNPPVINAGDAVTMQFSTNALSIKTVGKALDSGALGDTIRVRNDESHTIIQAKIINSSMVEAVPLGTLVAANE